MSDNPSSGRDDKEFRQIDNVIDYQNQDLARTYGFTKTEGQISISSEEFERQHQQLMEQGYIILERIISDEQLAAVRAEAEVHLGHFGRNSFEGERTQRIYGVPQKMRTADCFIEHPLVLAHLDRVMQPSYLLSQAQVINIQDQSPAQPLHTDDNFYRVPRPRPALSVATVFAIDDFTEDNGATVAIPRSHHWDDERLPSDDDKLVKAVMPAGSCILFLGTLWHGGGENFSGNSRLALTCQYCEPYLRTQENFFLSVAPETVVGLSENLKRLLGYSIHPPFMGMVNGMHPKRTLPGA